jgi:drug/metabolite transporter (DMT)-like permease
MSPQQRPMTAHEWGLLLLLSVLWGGSFFFVGVAVKQLAPFTIVAARVSIAAALLWLTAPVTGLSPKNIRANFGALLILGLINNAIPFVLIVWGRTRLASGLASILNASTPVITVVAAHFLTTTERLTALKFGGALFGLAGVAVMIGPDFTHGLGRNLFAELAVLGAALSYAFASLYGRRFRGLGLAPIDVAAGQISGSSLILVPLALLVDQPWILPPPSLPVVGAILGLAALSTAFAYIVYFRILAGAGATNVVLVTLLAPATSVLLGAVSLGEHLAPRDFLGLALIALGLALIDGRPLQAIALGLACFRQLRPLRGRAKPN